MNIEESVKIAFAALRLNKLRSFLTMLGIIIGVTSVVLLVSLGAGLQSYITSQFEQLGSNLLFIIPGRIGFGGRGPGGATINKLTQKHVDQIEKRVDGLLGVVPTVQQFTTVKYQSKVQKDVTIIGTTEEFDDVVNLTAVSGNFFDKNQVEAGKKVAVIGKTIAEDVFGDKNPIGQKIDIKGQKYTVLGILKAQGSTFGIDQDNVVVIPIIAAQRQFGFDQINNIYARVQDQEMVNETAEAIKKVLLADLSEDDFSVMTAEETLATIRSILGVISAALSGIAAISLIVGGIGISNIMLVSVTERTREIGLRKAVGATPQHILLQFLTEAVILSLAGGLIGLLLALSGTFVANRFVPATITPWAIFIAFGFSVLVGIIFGVAPAIRAARLSPIDALRYE